MIKRILLIAVGVIALLAVSISFAITRDGHLITPQGEGVVELDSGSFEAFPLPDYAANAVSEDYLSYFIEVEPGIKVHILEVGSGYPVWLQHGNPTSGLLYRRIAEELPTDEMRLIMPTLVGLGFSSKVPASEHTMDNHIRWIGEALSQLELEELVYVGQDWGGAIGMGVLERSPELVHGAVMLNTAINAPRGTSCISRAHSLAKTPIVGELLLENLVPLFDQLSQTQGDPASMGPEVTALYGRPVLESGNAKGPLAMMRMVPCTMEEASAANLQVIEAFIPTLDIPAEIVWGMSDPIFAPTLHLMQAHFPDAPVTETEAGHFLQEEVPSEIAAAIIRVVAQIQAPAAAAEEVSPDEATPDEDPGQNPDQD